MTNIDFTPSGVQAMKTQLERDEMVGTLWHVYKRRTTTSVFEIRFSNEGNKVEVTDNGWITLNFTWNRIDQNNIAIMDGSTQKWKCQKLDNTWLSLFKIFDDGQEYWMYLIDAQKSNLMGYLQPRSYITLHRPNYSIMNNRNSPFSKNGNFIKTTYNKVRLVFEKGKPLRIDCCDFTFAES